MKTGFVSRLGGCLCAIFCISANADLQSRLGGQAVYDTDLGITWLADAGGTGSPRGLMTWADAEAFVAGFSLNGATEWRLPATVNPDPGCQSPATSSGFNCAGSEMGHLFYVELNGMAGQPVTNGTDPDLELFSNLAGADWWSGTSFTIPEFAWHFRFANGLQDANNKETFTFFVWPVHDGDVYGIDTDGDNVDDAVDNCTLVANGNQRDTDADGIGNACDPDVAIPNDCSVNFPDLNVYKANFFAPGNLDTDNNGDGQTNFLDLNVVKSFFFGQPGPSANGCN